jgi:hypothetical protein
MAIFIGAVEVAIAKVIRVYGIKESIEHLATIGVQVLPGQKKRKFSVSAGTLRKIARKFGITLKRGRPRKYA